jgi:hypothetical protein
MVALLRTIPSSLFDLMSSLMISKFCLVAVSREVVRPDSFSLYSRQTKTSLSVILEMSWNSVPESPRS